jgi:hypothetical protein
LFGNKQVTEKERGTCCTVEAHIYQEKKKREKIILVKTICLLRNSSLSFFVLESLANRRFFIVPGEQDVQFRFQFLVLPQAVQVQKKGGVIFWI